MDCFQLLLSNSACAAAPGLSEQRGEPGRGLHSFTFQLNLSALYGMGSVRKGLCSPVEGVFRMCGVFIETDTAQVELGSV